MRPGRTRASLRAAFAFDKFYPEKLKRQASFVFVRAPRPQNLSANKHRALVQAPKYAAFGRRNKEPCKLAKRQLNSRRNLASSGHFGFTGNTAYATGSASSRYDLAKR